MPFDKLDKKAREAAKNYRPAYTEEAWNKMEALLDKHMPLQNEQQQPVQKKHPERWLFLLLALTGGLFLMLLLTPQKDERIDNAPPGISKNRSSADAQSGNTVLAESPDQRSNIRRNSGTENPPKTGQVSTLTPGGDAGKSTMKNSTRTDTYKSSLKADVDNNNADEFEYNKKMQAGQVQTRAPVEYAETRLIYQPIGSGGFENKKIIANEISLTDLSKSGGNLEPGKEKPVQRNKNKFGNAFSLILSAGPDVSAVNFGNTGTLKLLLGAGIGYKFGEKLQLRTGVYTVKKVYNANPSDYHPPVNFWNYYPQLDNIDADCRVIEIPLIINYAFSQKNNHAWFASAGISSYFMKRETYKYVSKISPGVYQERSYTIRNQNNHYFSSLRLSAGYERKLNNKISFSTEPYVNLPLSGIGYGKVKLKSAGVLFTISVKPFTHNK